MRTVIFLYLLIQVVQHEGNTKVSIFVFDDQPRNDLQLYACPNPFISPIYLLIYLFTNTKLCRRLDQGMTHSTIGYWLSICGGDK